METRAADISRAGHLGLGWLQDVFDGQRGHLFGWLPICLACGIGWYFALPAEPDQTFLLSLAACVFAIWGLRLGAGPALTPIALAITMVATGFALTVYRAHSVAAPVMEFRFYGAIEGRIVNIDRSQSDKPRLTLDQVILDGIAPDRTPALVRVSLHGDQPFLVPEPGMVVMMTGHLSPPAGPVEPGGFDFQRKAWFDRLGGLGYTRVPALLLEPAKPDGFWLWMANLRADLTAAIKTRMGGREGPFAAAIITGDRSDIDPVALEALRASNLAHLLAISGLHVGLLTGVIYAMARFGMACVPQVSMRFHPKRFAAVLAFLAALFYLGISGASIATQRAFIMATVMLAAICLERRAISLRSVAIAALIVLVWTPEALIGPGFQMSFAATTALVAVFAILRDVKPEHRLPKWTRGATSLVMASAIAGIATAPYGAAHFNQVAHYGLIANLASVPVMGTIVMPGAVAAAALAPLGLDWIGLGVMRWGLWWIIFVAETVSAWDGSVSKIPAPGLWVLPLITLGGLFVLLWRGRARWAGLSAIVAAGVIWLQTPRPEILVTETGLVFGVMTSEGRVVNKPRGDGFSTRSWLENDGDRADQETAAARGNYDPKFAELGGGSIIFDSSQKLTIADVERYCRSYQLVIVAAFEQDASCDIINQNRLRQTGAFSVALTENGPRITTSREVQGDRLWLR